MSNASQPEGRETGRMGRPRMPDSERQERFRRFLDRVEQGDSLKLALEASGEVWGTISRWIVDERNVLPATEEGSAAQRAGLTYAAAYARARSMSATWWEDRATQYANAANPEWVQVARLQVDNAKWRAAMADPKTYGERRGGDVTVNVSLGALHLDALRKVSASAKVSKDNHLVEDAQVIGELPSGPIQGE